MIKAILEYFNNLWYSYFKINNRTEGIIMQSINMKLEEQANSILVAHDMLKLPVDLIKIASDNNIDVYYRTLPNGVSGAIKYDEEEKKFKILIEKNESRNRQRFTLAHELAHYFLMKDSLEMNQEIHIDTCYRKEKNSTESDVDYLAGALLMDKTLLERAYQITPSVKQLAQLFGVSESAMTVRLMKLGLM